MTVFGPHHRKDMIEADLRVKKAMNSGQPGIKWLPQGSHVFLGYTSLADHG